MSEIVVVKRTLWKKGSIAWASRELPETRLFEITGSSDRSMVGFWLPSRIQLRAESGVIQPDWINKKETAALG